MRYALDTEFIDTATCSELISLALVSEDDRELYLEFPYTESEVFPWLQDNVIKQLGTEKVTFKEASIQIQSFIGIWDVPQIWAYYASHDWYWFCRVMGGMMNMPVHYPHRVMDFANYQQGIPNLHGPEHHALNDAKSLMSAMRKLKVKTLFGNTLW